MSRPVWQTDQSGAAQLGRGRGRGGVKPHVGAVPATAMGFSQDPPPMVQDAPSDEDEDVQMDASVEKSLFSSYLEGAESDQGLEQGLSRVRQHLYSTICLVCLEKVPADAAIWTCQKGCHTVFHLMCIQTWAKQEADRNALRAVSNLDPHLFPNAQAKARAQAKWHCPKCRIDHGVDETPTKYLCYCSKENDPVFDPWLTPHSCGERCDKQLGACDHTCKLLCHPGPCPPCPRVVQAACFCGKVHSARRCGSSPTSCGKTCTRLLDCGVHRCTQKCHEGTCKPCDRKTTSTCQCGSTTQARPCAERKFQCEKICGKTLDCGHHTCDRVCHDGRCGLP